MEGVLVTVRRAEDSFAIRKKAIFDQAEMIPKRECVHCGKPFTPRYRNKGDYCSRKCYMQAYYAANRDTKWKTDGAWRN